MSTHAHAPSQSVITPSAGFWPTATTAMAPKRTERMWLDDGRRAAGARPRCVAQNGRRAACRSRRRGAGPLRGRIDRHAAASARTCPLCCLAVLSASAAPTKRAGRGADGGGRQRQRGGRAAAQWLGRIVSIAIACPARQANTRLLSQGWRLVQLHAAANHRKGGAGWRVLIV